MFKYSDHHLDASDSAVLGIVVALLDKRVAQSAEGDTVTEVVTYGSPPALYMVRIKPVARDILFVA